MNPIVADAGVDQRYLTARRAAAAQATMAIRALRLSLDLCQDLQQDSFLELWRKAPTYDASRGSWRTFSEHVVRNRIRTVSRSLRRAHARRADAAPIEKLLLTLRAPDRRLDLRLDIDSVLASVPDFDRSVARSLVNYSAAETGEHLGVSRGAIYRAVGRLRTAFAIAGFSPSGHSARRCKPPRRAEVDGRAA